MSDDNNKARTGIAGLDDVLGGGLYRNRLYLLEGQPGTGKTTLALQFLLEGCAHGERVLYFTLSETAEELRHGAETHGWSLEGIDIFEVVSVQELLDDSQRQSLLYSSDLELGETANNMFRKVEELKPSRVVVDSLSEIRLLSQSSLRYRRQVLAMKHRFAQLGATVLLLDDMTSEALDKTVHSVAHGVIKLEELTPDYGSERRRLRIVKYRGQRYRGGYHDFNIHTGGVVVFPALVASEHRLGFGREKVGSGNPEFDQLLGGGLEHGTSALMLGPTGAGKSLLALSFIVAAIERGERAALFAFDEDIDLLTARAESIGMKIGQYVADGRLILQQVDAAELSPGEFAHQVRHCVEKQQVTTVMIDSLNGYQLAMPDERFLILHMHELLTYLNRSGIVTFLTVAQHGLVGTDMQSPVDLTYLSDTVVLLRYFEALGRVRRAVSILKKRDGFHENTIREFMISSTGLQVGEPLDGFQGVLRGVPEFVGRDNTLLDNDK
ncbi:ATPase domain-containing protein [Uliginosibacterium sp. H3]|uniref:non-specific serine/threonine protein kinase n=1 Tax=Uliginosibacterium silvisoli TaxID=3114758 RepID=A0ABU6K8E6_9RHOO|nr:ATPase domain-containing protein [Uliginosibacterium sp. H3]